MELEYCRTLPPELLVEMHKCLPLPDAIYVLVNVSKTFVLNNSTRIRRNIQRLKESLEEFNKLANDAEEEEEKIDIETEDYPEFEWKPQFDALLHYGGWMTSRKLFSLNGNIVGIPKNFLEKLLLRMANSRSTQMMLEWAQFWSASAPIPIPIFIIEQLFNEKQYRIDGNRILFEYIQLETDDGQILRIHSGETYEVEDIEGNVCTCLKLFMMNKDWKNWFEIQIWFWKSSKEIYVMEYFRIEMEDEEVAELKRKHQNKFGKKREEANDDEEEYEDGPTCSAKIMKGLKLDDG